MNDSAAPVFDVAIAGGGMVGASLALALADSAVSVVMIEASPPDEGPSASFDDRTTALGNGARRIFQTLGVWQDIAREAAPIREIHVSDAGRFGFARLRGFATFGVCAMPRDPRPVSHEQSDTNLFEAFNQSPVVA